VGGVRPEAEDEAVARPVVDAVVVLPEEEAPRRHPSRAPSNDESRRS